jgi:hypothetical protein
LDGLSCFQPSGPIQSHKSIQCFLIVSNSYCTTFANKFCNFFTCLKTCWCAESCGPLNRWVNADRSNICSPIATPIRGLFYQNIHGKFNKVDLAFFSHFLQLKICHRANFLMWNQRHRGHWQMTA